MTEQLRRMLSKEEKLLKKDAIRETDSDLKSDLSSIFAADLNKTPPLVITKSIELPKTTLKNMNLNDLKINVEPLKIRKIPHPQTINPIEKEEIKTCPISNLNPNVKEKIPPALMPSMMKNAINFKLKNIKMRNVSTNHKARSRMKIAFLFNHRFKSLSPFHQNQI